MECNEGANKLQERTMVMHKEAKKQRDLSQDYLRLETLDPQYLSRNQGVIRKTFPNPHHPIELATGYQACHLNARCTPYFQSHSELFIR